MRTSPVTVARTAAASNESMRNSAPPSGTCFEAGGETSSKRSTRSSGRSTVAAFNHSRQASEWQMTTLSAPRMLLSSFWRADIHTGRLGLSGSGSAG